jgi:hypothetical protein
MVQGGIRFSTRLFLIGLILFATACGLFYCGMTTGLQPAQGAAPYEPMRVFGLVSGTIGGFGVVAIRIGFVRRAMRKYTPTSAP